MWTREVGVKKSENYADIISGSSLWPPAPALPSVVHLSKRTDNLGLCKAVDYKIALVSNLELCAELFPSPLRLSLSSRRGKNLTADADNINAAMSGGGGGGHVML